MKRKRLLPILAALLLVCSPSLLWSAPPTIESISPCVGTRGTSFQVKLIGSGLTSASQILFYSEELRCDDFEAESEYEATATISSTHEASLGTHVLRVANEDGISPAKIIRLSPLPVLEEPMEGATVKPMEIRQPNVTIHGKLESRDRDRYQIFRKRGQRLSAEVEAIRLGSSLLDTVLRINGPDGSELVNVDDTSLFQQDPAASLIAEQDGIYTVEVHETNYEGDTDATYALHIGDFPPSAVAYPGGGKSGETINVQFLSASGNDKPGTFQQVSLPSIEDDFALFREVDGNRSVTSIPFRRSPFGNFLESEPNDRLNDVSSNTEASEIPIAFNGILARRGDIDCFTFRAEAGRPIRLEVFATRLGSPADTRIEVKSLDGLMLAQNDDWGSHDSRIDWTPSETGTYLLTITDKLEFGSPDAVYRIEATHLQPSAIAFLPRPDRMSQQGQTISVPQGNRALVRVGVRRQYVDGPVTLVWSDLPTGLSVSEGEISANQFWTPVVIESSFASSPVAELVNLSTSCVSDRGTKVEGSFEQTVDLITESADRLFHSVQLDRVPLAISPPVPFRIELETPSTFLPAGGTLELKVHVDREKGFSAPIEVRLPFVPPWVVCPDSISIPSDQSTGTIKLEAKSKIERRSWSIAATAKIDATATQGDTSQWNGREVSSGLVKLKIADPPITGTLSEMASEQGRELLATCQIQATGSLPDRMTATLEGLPNRIESEDIEWTLGSDVLKFRIKIADDAPLGEFANVQVRLAGQQNEVGVSYIIAAGSKLQITPPGKLVRGDDGEVLTPLQVLRRTRSQAP